MIQVVKRHSRCLAVTVTPVVDVRSSEEDEVAVFNSPVAAAAAVVAVDGANLQGNVKLMSARPPHGTGASYSPLSLYFPVFLSGFNYFLLSSIPFLSTRIVPLRFQAGGHRKRPNLGFVCCVYFVLSVFLS